jgi:hypothetical protein
VNPSDYSPLAPLSIKDKEQEYIEYAKNNPIVVKADPPPSATMIALRDEMNKSPSDTTLMLVYADACKENGSDQEEITYRINAHICDHMEKIDAMMTAAITGMGNAAAATFKAMADAWSLERTRP